MLVVTCADGSILTMNPVGIGCWETTRPKVSFREFETIIRQNPTILGILMPGMVGMCPLDLIRMDFPELTMVIMTVYGYIDTATATIKTAPTILPPSRSTTMHLVLRLEKTLGKGSLLKENTPR